MTRGNRQHIAMRFFLASFFFLTAGLWQDPITSSVMPEVGSKGESAAMFRSTLKETASARMEHAFEQFIHGYTWVELVAGMLLAVGLASLIAWHPRGRRQADMLEAHEERKTFVVLGLLASVVSILVVIDQTMAFVVFGIGSLIRFRTVLDNPRATGKAILVVVIGLACGLTQWVTAIAVALLGWVILWWIERSRAARIKVRIPDGADRQKVALLLADCLQRMRCKIKGTQVGKSGRAISYFALVPCALEADMVQSSLVASVQAECASIEVECELS